MQGAAVDGPLTSIRWFHRIDLGDGITTPGSDDTPSKLEQIRLPRDLFGQSVLDIGAWDGFFSFECERRGAARVVALDGGVWAVPSIGPHGFRYAHSRLNSHVEPIEMDVHEITPESVGLFDLVLCLGVLYHVRHPLLALSRVAAVTRHRLILETHVDLLDVNRPVLAFYPGEQCAQDASNWFGPNRAAVEAMLRVVGFERVQSFSATGVPYSVEGAQYGQFGRMVFHACK